MEVVLVNCIKITDTPHTLLQGLDKEWWPLVAEQKNQEPDHRSFNIEI